MQDQRRLGAIIVPNKEEILTAAKRSSAVNADASEVTKEKMEGILHNEIQTW